MKISFQLPASSFPLPASRSQLGDHALSWIRREGKGRVFYEAHGRNEQAYANRLLLEHVLTGMQYVLADLPAEDSPSVRK